MNHLPKDGLQLEHLFWINEELHAKSHSGLMAVVEEAVKLAQVYQASFYIFVNQIMVLVTPQSTSFAVLEAHTSYRAAFLRARTKKTCGNPAKYLSVSKWYVACHRP